MTTVSPLPPVERCKLLGLLSEPTRYDIAVIGGGATGLGVALDAAARGFRVVLIEAHDFAKGTSSRATKLLHGGVRYLAQGNVALVTEALRERTILLKNAPHLAQPLSFVMPSYRWWETPFYGLGLKLYDTLAGKASLGQTEFLNRQVFLDTMPAAKLAGLKGGVKYWDGQFNDARLAIALARTAAAQGALLINYCRATGLLFDGDKICGLTCEDTETGKQYRIDAACVINATGVWVDEIMRLDKTPKQERKLPSGKGIVAPSQGVHIVVDQGFLASESALMIPKTRDGRVLFAVPWLGKVILGTTDTPREDVVGEPVALREEVEFILGESASYLQHAPDHKDIRSIWVGLRPLVKPENDGGLNTKAISREHTILISPHGLVTVTGGKWTTYRAMAEDVLEQAQERGLIRASSAGLTRDLVLKGGEGLVADEQLRISSIPDGRSYGSEQAALESLPGRDRWLAAGLSEAMVRFAARQEYARTVEDVLARRSRILFLDARVAKDLAEPVASILREELDVPVDTGAFKALADRYLNWEGAPGK